jgi:hypothetical protein
MRLSITNEIATLAKQLARNTGWLKPTLINAHNFDFVGKLVALSSYWTKRQRLAVSF